RHTVRKLLPLSFVAVFVGCKKPPAADSQPESPIAKLEALLNRPEPEPTPTPAEEPETTDPAELRQRGNRSINNGEVDLAIEFYTTSIASGEDPRTYFDRANAYMAKNELDKALADYDKAVELDPKQ